MPAPSSLRLARKRESTTGAYRFTRQPESRPRTDVDLTLSRAPRWHVVGYCAVLRRCFCSTKPTAGVWMTIARKCTTRTDCRSPRVPRIHSGSRESDWASGIHIHDPGASGLRTGAAFQGAKRFLRDFPTLIRTPGPAPDQSPLFAGRWIGRVGRNSSGRDEQ